MTWRQITQAAMYCLVIGSNCVAQNLSGLWDAEIECPGGAIQFGLELKQDSQIWSGFLLNGPERIPVPNVEVDGNQLVLKIDHYDSKIHLNFAPIVTGGKAVGTWKKLRGPGKWLTMKCSARPHRELKLPSPDKAFLGRFAVKFSSSEEPAVGLFKQAEGSNRVYGTFLTTTGDYRFLDGYVTDGKLQLSCFDGAHAFLFHAELDGSRSLKGEFWSSSSWHETWTAKLDPGAKLPDDFKQTRMVEEVDWGSLSFPDLEGNPTSLNDPKFAGKARIIYVFGSWCPNCHDAGEYFAALDEKYGDKGLSILGLAFEHTGDFERDAEQVRKYLKRHGVSYPVLIAGLSDKAKASQTLPILDRIRSYPTTIFVDKDNAVTAVHTGFTGPATGEAFTELKQKFEKIITENLVR